jgi:predicted protein tyrosine phosphatase
MEYITSTLKIAYDKLSNLIMPSSIINVQNIDNNNIIETQPQLCECITNLKTITDNDIDDPQFDLNKTGVRIFPTMPYLEQISWFYGEPTYIKNKIFLGSSFNAATKSMLDKHNVKYIINITAEINNYYPDNITYVNYRLYDNNKETIIHFLEDSYKKIKEFQEKDDGNILIHCFMGASRSATLVAYYLMREYNIDPYYAYKLLKKRRKLVNPTRLLYNDLKKIKKCFKITYDVEHSVE